MKGFPRMGGDPKSRPHPPPGARYRGRSPGTEAGPLGGTPTVPRAWGTFRDSAAALQSPRLAKQSERSRRVRPARGCRSRRGENRGRCAQRAGAKLPRRIPRSGARPVSPLLAGRRPPPTAPGPASLPLASVSSPFFSFPPSPRLAATFVSAGSRLPSLPGAGPSRRGRAEGGSAPGFPAAAANLRAARGGVTPQPRPGGSSRPRPPRARRGRGEERATALSQAEPSRGLRAREAATAARSPGELTGAGPRAGDAAPQRRSPAAPGALTLSGRGTAAGIADKALRPAPGSLHLGDPTCAAPRSATWGPGPPAPLPPRPRRAWGLGVASVAGPRPAGGGGGGPGVWNRCHPGPGQSRILEAA